MNEHSQPIVEISVIRSVPTARGITLPECKIVANAAIDAHVGTPHYKPDEVQTLQSGELHSAIFILHENAVAHVTIGKLHITIINAGIVLGCFVYGKVAFRIKTALGAYSAIDSEELYYSFGTIRGGETARFEILEVL